jgi:outer membrane receptor protein involved in Fe transport
MPIYTIARLPPIALLALAAIPVARAADRPVEILVTGHGLGETPATPAYDVQTIPREALVETASGRIEDALADVAGFQQFRRSDSRSSNPSAQGATLRALGGNAASRALVLLDGVPMADPFFGYIPFSALVPDRLARVRVIRGGGSGAFGAGAVAGVLGLESAGARELGLLNLSVLGNDRGESEVSGAVAPRLGDGFAVVTGRWDRGQGFWTTPPEQRVAASVRAAYESWSTGVRAVVPVAPDIELQARGLAFGDRRVLRFAGGDTGAQGQDASLRLVGRGRWQFDALAYLQARGFDSVTISSAPPYRPVLNQFRTPATGWGGKLEVRPPVGAAHTARIGTDARIGSGSTHEESYSAATGLVTARREAGGRNGDIGFYAEDDWRTGALTLTGGARADRWTISAGHSTSTTPTGVTTALDCPTLAGCPDRSGWEASWRAGALLALGHGLALRVAGYSNFRQPTLNELYRRFTVFPVTTQANSGLRNEHLHGVEAGFDFAPVAGVSLSLTAFSDRLDDAIANVTINSGTGERKRLNVDAIRARGIEATAHLAHGPVSLDGSLAWTDAKVRASGVATALDGLRPAQTPRLAASATLAWRPRAGWDLAATLRHTGAQFEDDQNIDTLPATTTIGAFVQVPLSGPFSLVLRGENLTGARIVTRYQSAQPGSTDLGTPRTLWAGIRVRLV